MKAEFVGRVVRRMEVQEFALTQTTYPRGAFIPWHSHDHVYLCLVLAGTFRERHRREHRICGPSSFLYYPPDEPHAESFHGSKALLLNIQLSDRWLGGIRPHLSFDGAPRHIEDGLLTALGIRLLRELHTDDSAAVVAIEGLLLELMAALSRSIRTPKQASPPAWLTRAREVIHERFVENLRLADLGQAVGVHPVYLSGAFSQHYGSSIGSYIRKLRIDFACRQLLESDCALADLALKAGFFDQSHFCRVFKRSTGLTPSEFRSRSCS